MYLMSRVFFWLNRNCPNCVRYSSCQVPRIVQQRSSSQKKQFKDYQLIHDHELLLYYSDSLVNMFLADMAKKKTFAGGMHFPHLAHLRTPTTTPLHLEPCLTINRANYNSHT